MYTMFFKILTKITSQNEGGGQANADRADRGGRGVGVMLTMADKGERGGWGNADNG